MTIVDYYRKTLGKSHSQIFAMLKKKEKAKLGPKLIDVILTASIEGLGNTGDVVQVHPARMRAELYPSRMAVYATDENLHKLAIKPFRVKKMMQEMGLDEGEAWKLVDAEVERRAKELEEKRAIIHYPRWFVAKYPEYASESNE